MAANARLICLGADLTDGGPGVRFTVDWHGVEEAAFAVRFQGRAFAYLNRCGHVPVELDWQQNEFFDDSKLYLMCATHGAIYSPQDGRCLAGGEELEPPAHLDQGAQPDRVVLVCVGDDHPG